MIRLILLACSLCLLALTTTAIAAADGSKADPLRVMLIPADGGTAEGTIADFQPVFNAVSKSTDLHFDIRVGQSYSAVIEAMANRHVDIAFFGAVSYLACRERGWERARRPRERRRPGRWRARSQSVAGVASPRPRAP